MEYSKIIAVSGLPGLYELISSKNDGAIVRSLDDKSTKFVSSRIHNFSHLESIEIYTIRDNVNLVDVLKAIQGSSAKAPDLKDNTAVKKYFESVYPDLDFERVYASDMKKILKWWEVLKSNDVEIKLSEPPAVEEEAEVEEEEPVKPAKKTAEKEKPAKEAKETKKKEPAKEKEEEPKPKKAAKPAAAKETKAKSAKPKKEETKSEAPKKKAAPKKKK
jgi:hypothetical protein